MFKYVVIAFNLTALPSSLLLRNRIESSHKDGNTYNSLQVQCLLLLACPHWQLAVASFNALRSLSDQLPIALSSPLLKRRKNQPRKLSMKVLPRRILLLSSLSLLQEKLWQLISWHKRLQKERNSMKSTGRGMESLLYLVLPTLEAFNIGL
jgi:hypothetical protein